MDQQKPTDLAAWEKQLDEIRAQVRAFKAISPSDLAQFAATPEGREKMVTNKAYCARWRQLFAGATRELLDAERVLEKALRKGRWGIRA